MLSFKRIAFSLVSCIYWDFLLLFDVLQVIHITGRLRLRVSLSHGRTVPSQIMGLVVVAHSLPPPTINEVRIDCHMFVTRVNMDLNIIYCENRYSILAFIFPPQCCTSKCTPDLLTEIKSFDVDHLFPVIIMIPTELLYSFFHPDS